MSDGHLSITAVDAPPRAPHAKCIHGREELNRTQIEDALRDGDEDGGEDHLQPFPDAVPALRALAGMGYELAVLSNGTPAMIRNCLDNSGLGDFGERISVDEVRVFKPSPVVYRHAAGRLSLPIRQIRLVTCNAFDSVGASAAGMRTAWVNRSAAPFDTIGAQPDLTVPALDRMPAALAG